MAMEVLVVMLGLLRMVNLLYYRRMLVSAGMEQIAPAVEWAETVVKVILRIPEKVAYQHQMVVRAEQDQQ